MVLLKGKLRERKDKQDRLSELMEERQTIDKNIEEGNREYEDFQKSEEFLNTSKILEKIKRQEK